MFGKLTWAAIPFNEPIPLITSIVVLLVIFGPKRLPEMGRSLGKGMREFKDSVTGNDDEPHELPRMTEDEPVSTRPRDDSVT
jgi:sec-independent protein translocase protein TatA